MSEEELLKQCPYCFKWKPAEVLKDHIVDVHGVDPEEAEELAESAPTATKEEATRESAARAIEKFAEIEKEPESTVPRSSEIIQEILDRYRVKGEVAEMVVAEVADLEEGRNHELGQFVTPQEVAYVLQVAGIKQPKLQYIINKYSQKVWKLQTEIQQKLMTLGTMPTPTMPGLNIPPNVPMMQNPIIPPFMPPMNLYMMNPYGMPPYGPDPYRRRDESRIPVKLDDKSPPAMVKPTELMIMKFLQQMEEEARMRREEFELRMAKLKKELEESTGKKDDETKRKLEEMEKKFEQMREELHKKDLEILKTEFKHTVDKLKQPDLFTQLQYITSVAERLGYTRGGQTGIQVLDTQMQRIDRTINKLIDAMREAALVNMAAKKKRRTPREREELVEQFEEKANLFEETDKLINDLDNISKRLGIA